MTKFPTTIYKNDLNDLWNVARLASAARLFHDFAL